MSARSTRRVVTWIRVPAGTLHTTRCTSDLGRLPSVYTPGGGAASRREVESIDQSDLGAVLALADRHGMTVRIPDAA